MTPARTRLGVLMAATMTLLAVATLGQDIAESHDLNVVEASQPAAVATTADIGTADGWCALRKPHTGDTVTYAEWFDMDPGVTANCVATHGGVFHFYRVTVWADGHVEWTPLGPWWT